MKEQVRAAAGMIVQPKTALLELPSDRFYLLAFVIFEYLIFETVRGDRWVFTLMGVGAVFFPIGALILKGIVRLFGKNLSLKKVMNIVGYAQTPRLVTAWVYFLTRALMPPEMRAAMEAPFSFPEQYETLVIVLALLGILIFCYSVFLLIWGLVISPDTGKEGILSKPKDAP